jgi:scyllo-inositol 2-dehydrogenase (NADP+)
MKLGIIGFGRIVELVHIPQIRKIEEIEIYGVYDITESRLSVASNRKFQVFSQLNKLLENDIDTVLIATPPDSHYSIAIQALENNKHIIIEKPFTITSDEAKKIKSLGKEKNRYITAYHNRRFTPDYKLVKKVLNENILGKISFIERRYHAFGAPVWFGVKTFNPNWRVSKASGGGALYDWGIHLIDQMIDLNLGRVSTVESIIRKLPGYIGETEDYVHANIIFENELSYIMDINFRSDVNEPLWIIGGEEKTLCIKSESEAYLMQKGRNIETLEMEKGSRMDGSEIYLSMLKALSSGIEPVISIDQVISGLELLEKINKTK